MTINEGTLDRAVRVAVGVILLAGMLIGPRTSWGLVGLLPLLTGLTGFCPTYTLLGISTRAGGKASAPGE